MKSPIQYYYYYYGGGYHQWENSKAQDIQVVFDFLSELMDSIEKLTLNGESNKKLRILLETDQKSTTRNKRTDNSELLEGWVNDVKNKIYIELRDLKFVINNPDSIEKKWLEFDKVGLTGVQLKAKITIWNKLFEKIRNLLTSSFESFKSRIKDVILALKASNIILKSMLAVIPGAESLVELKDFYEITLE